VAKLREALRTNPRVEVRSVFKWFGKTAAVRNASFTVADGQSVCLLGPSGCGKTTILRMIAGLETPDSGTIEIDGTDVSHRPPYSRNIGLVFQDYALFPQMNVIDNVAFGLRHRGVPKSEIQRRVAEALTLVKLTGYETRKPSQLSGGQQQRVAVARALVTRPAVLLLDEPLSNLDAKLRVDLRVQLRSILAAVRTTTIIVTHDQDEAMALADHIIVMSGGVIEQTGRPLEIYDSPNSRFVAEFIGRSNWLSGTVTATRDGLAQIALDRGGSLFVASTTASVGEAFDICLRPERLSLGLRGTPQATEEDYRINRLSGRVRHVESLGSHLHLYVALERGDTMLAILLRSNIQDFDGTEVDLVFSPSDALLIPRVHSAAEGEQKQ